MLTYRSEWNFNNIIRQIGVPELMDDLVCALNGYFRARFQVILTVVSSTILGS